MKSIKKTTIVAGVLAAVLVPALTFAATATGSLGMTRTAPDFTKLPQTVQDTLKAQGVTIPTAEALKAFELKMQNERVARKGLTDADELVLQSIKEKAQAEERAFLRTKGADLPSEDEIAQMKKFRESLKAAIGAMPYSSAIKMKKEFKQNMGNEMGGDRGENGGRGMGEQMNSEKGGKGMGEGMRSEKGGKGMGMGMGKKGGRGMGDNQSVGNQAPNSTAPNAAMPVTQ
jgi:hypothetical protein